MPDEIFATFFRRKPDGRNVRHCAQRLSCPASLEAGAGAGEGGTAVARACRSAQSDSITEGADWLQLGESVQVFNRAIDREFVISTLIPIRAVQESVFLVFNNLHRCGRVICRDWWPSSERRPSPPAPGSGSSWTLSRARTTARSRASATFTVRPGKVSSSDRRISSWTGEGGRCTGG